MYRPRIISRRRSKILARTTGLVTFMVMALSGAAFASLQSIPAVLKGNDIATATANLLVGTDGNTYAKSLDGYSFGALVPGGQPTPINGYPVYVKNAGSTPLALKLSIASTLTNPNNVDLSKVHLILSPMGSGAPQNITLAALLAANTTGGVAITQASRIIPGASNGFTMQISLDNDSVDGASASIGNIDFLFGGMATN